jgi:Protein of unknown function (DUF2946)
MRFRGVIQDLIRERQPFAVLAILAAMLPYILSGAGLTFAGGIRLDDGTLVICTSHGFERVADDKGSQTHDVDDCCKFGCVHVFSKVAIGPAPVVEPVRIALVGEIAWPPLAGRARHATAAAAPNIRAPPAASA